jgi:hypothetical protein
VIVPAPVPILHFTPAFAESFDTVAVKDCVPPPASDAVAALTLTVIGFRVTLADADFDGSVMLVAVSVTVATAPTKAGAE